MDVAALWRTVTDAVTATQPAPPRWLVLACAGAALLAVVPRPLWRLSRNVVTIAHEGGHGLAALLTRRRLSGIRLHSDTSGLTISSGPPTGPGMILTAAAGYTAPPLLGLGGAALLAGQHVTQLLWISVVLLAGLLVMIRNLYGLLSVVVTGGTFFLVSWYGGSQLQSAFAYAGVWFLLLAGVRPVLELQGKRRREGARSTDADQLARLTGLGPLLWVTVFLLVALVSLALGAAWLLG